MAKYSYAQSAKQRSAFVKFVRKYKSLTAERLFWMYAQFFPLSNLKKKIFLGVELSGYCVPGEKKAKNGSSGALHATWRIPLHASTNNQRPRGHTGNWNSKYIYSIEPSLKLHVKLEERTFETPWHVEHDGAGRNFLKKDTKNTVGLGGDGAKLYTYLFFSKIQLVVHYQCCVLIGWASTRLYGYSLLVAKSAGFENQNNGDWIAFC